MQLSKAKATSSRRILPKLCPSSAVAKLEKPNKPANIGSKQIAMPNTGMNQATKLR